LDEPGKCQGGTVVLSDFFYCGIVAGGAMIGVGQLARAIPRDQVLGA
jgi:hypothetical protein